MDKTYQHLISLIPDSLDFNFIPVQNETCQTITFDNISDVSIFFIIDHSKDYIFEPNTGVVTKNKKLEIKIKILPTAASVLVANAKITFDNKVSKVIKMSSISKYPYLRLSKEALDFGIVPIGKSHEEELVITNPESVAAKFTITRQSIQPGKHPEAFFISDLTGEVPPNSCFLLKIKFKTVFPSTTSYDNYQLEVKGGNKLRFTCSGSSSSLNTWLGAKTVNFKSIQLGTQMTKLIRIHNDSDQPTEYQMYYKNDGAFSITKMQGIIPAKGNLRINVTFKPYETIVYYERVFCLTKNHFLTVIDLYGTAHNLLIKPKMLEQKYIDIFRFKLLNGFYFGKTLQGKESEILDKLNRTFIQKTSMSDDKNNEDALVAFTNQTQLHKEMFWEQTSPNRIISCDVEHIDFNYVGEKSVSEPYIIHVHNNSNEKVKVKWIFDKPINLSNLVGEANVFNSENTIFFVQPEESIINKKNQAEFKVFFKPNKSEYYFYSDMPCQATIMTNYNTNALGGLPPIQNNKLSQTGLEMANLTQSYDNRAIAKKTKSSLTYKNNALMKSLNMKAETFEYFDPPVPLKVSLVGHSFPPGTQIFMPIYELSPGKELFFPSASINQSIYQTLKIKNNSDTPLFYKFSTDPLGVFRVYRKYGLIEANEFHLICIEFSPKDTTVYRFPLRIIFNHNNQNMKTLILNGLCTDPVIEIEGVRNEVYFPPTYIGIQTKKTLTLKNLSPIRVNVQISITQNPNAIVEVQPNYFEMDSNVVRNIEVSMIPKLNEEIITPMTINVERIYDPSNESIGIFNPGSVSLRAQNISLDKRLFKRELTLLGRGSDGDLKLDPIQLNFGTVKVGFHKKMSFAIFNPTLTNFYIKLVPEIENNNQIGTLTKKEQQEILQLDFTEGLINSFCQKDVNVSFHPKTRSALDVNVYVYASNNLTSPNTTNKLGNKMAQSHNQSVKFATDNFEPSQALKCQLRIKANGDYPLIKIVDLRNKMTGTCTLWKNFNVNEANIELQDKLTKEEINYMANDMTNKKSQDYQDKLKVVKCDFGKHLLKSALSNQKKGKQSYDVYLTLKNEGGVTSEFFFKFPDDVAIKREIWMDPVEPTSADKIEYHVLKESIFEIEPRKSKLEPNECCNIRFRYNIQEQGEHHLRVIFQIVNGKPLIFELNAESYLEKAGVLEIQKPLLDFSYVPIGFMTHQQSAIELTNVGGSKIKFHVDPEKITKFNEENQNVDVLDVENLDGILGPGDSRYLLVFFRPIAHKSYELDLIVYYTDDINVFQKPIKIKGHGYHPLQFTPPAAISPFENMPNYCQWNYFNGEMMQKCGLNIEEIDFGEMGDKPVTKTFILYNYSMTNSFSFDFAEPGFIIKDDLRMFPNKGLLEANSHKYIKMTLTPKDAVTKYEGELPIRIVWTNVNVKEAEKEMLNIRILKKTIWKNKEGIIEHTRNSNSSFVETLLLDLTKEILCSSSFDKLLMENLHDQPPGVYDWTNDISYPKQKDVRKKILDDYTHKVELYNEQTSVSSIRKNHYKMTAQSQSQGTKTNQPTLEAGPDEFGEQEDLKLQEKYSYDLLSKYKIPIREMNERLIVINDDSRNVITNTIMENTIFNILSEAVYGETNLTEKVRIYFFANKAQPQSSVAQSQANPIQLIKKEDDTDNANSSINNNRYLK